MVVAREPGWSIRLRRCFGSERDGKVVPGLSTSAPGASLYLNGLEDLSQRGQRALVGAIEQTSYTRVGGRERLPINVRWISSAQDGLESRAAPEPFRRDLIARLNVIALRVPPLRDYAEDVPDLLRYYVDRLVDEQHLPLRRFGVAAQNRLRNYPWPGNVDELKNLVQRVLILGAGEEIRLEEIERELAAKMGFDEPLVKQDLLALPLREAREQFERAYLQQQLLLCNGKVGRWPSEWAWSARICTASCGHWASISARATINELAARGRRQPACARPRSASSSSPSRWIRCRSAS